MESLLRKYRVYHYVISKKLPDIVLDEIHKGLLSLKTLICIDQIMLGLLTTNEQYNFLASQRRECALSIHKFFFELLFSDHYNTLTGAKTVKWGRWRFPENILGKDTEWEITSLHRAK